MAAAEDPNAAPKSPQTMTLREIQMQLESMYSLTILQDGAGASETHMIIGPLQALALHKASELLERYIIPRQEEFVRTFVKPVQQSAQQVRA